MSAQGQILPPRNVRGMSVIPPKAAVNVDIFVRPVRAISRHTPRSKIHALETLDALLCAHHHTHLNGYIEPACPPPGVKTCGETVAEHTRRARDCEQVADPRVLKSKNPECASVKREAEEERVQRNGDNGCPML